MRNKTKWGKQEVGDLGVAKCKIKEEEKDTLSDL